MAAFIVISADNRLHYLVDGIEKCRPLNPDVHTEISTGKIIKTDLGYTYEYTIHGEGTKGDGTKRLSDLLSNQLAAFRLAYHIPQEQLVNIFYLENPLTQEEFNESESWIVEFDKVYKNGLGPDTAFCLFRVVFSYCHEKPTDVCTQIDVTILKNLIKQHKEKRCQTECTYPNYLFYIDNQKSDASALCLTKKEHDFKMSRFLIDFMMLASNQFDSYRVLNSINGKTNDIRCFSVGFGESMYYYQDVEDYFCHADARDLFHMYLDDEDETNLIENRDCMDIEKYPFGLWKRQEKLAQLYEDVPFTVNVNNHPKSADKRINDHVVSLKDYLIEERDKEIKDFLESTPVKDKQKELEILENQIEQIAIREDETADEFEQRLQELLSQKHLEEEKLEEMIKSFNPKCPKYIDRFTIYEDLCVEDDESIEINAQTKRNQYDHLINYIISLDFLSYIRGINSEDHSDDSDDSSVQDSIPKQPNIPTEKPGCLAWLMFWKKSIPSIQSNIETINNHQEDSKEENNPNPSSHITQIKELLELKKEFVKFKDKVQQIEVKYDKEKSLCDDFKLQGHTNHYFHLIALPKLKETQANTFIVRINKTIDKWRATHHHTMNSLNCLCDKDSRNHTKEEYPFIDWEHPFPFTPELSAENNLPDICNELQKRAAPFVNYNLTQELKEEKIIRIIYSDRPDFINEFNKMKQHLNNGNEISACMSKHIASKICFVEFLPMDDEVLDNLVDLQQQEKEISNILGIEEHIEESGQTSTFNSQQEEGQEPHIIDWGDH